MQAKQHRTGAKSGLTLLQSIPMFAGLPDAQLEQISRMAVSRKVARDNGARGQARGRPGLLRPGWPR